MLQCHKKGQQIHLSKVYSFQVKNKENNYSVQTFCPEGWQLNKIKKRTLVCLQCQRPTHALIDGFTELPEQILSPKDYQRLISLVWLTQSPILTATYTVLTGLRTRRRFSDPNTAISLGGGMEFTGTANGQTVAKHFFNNNNKKKKKTQGQQCT